MNNKNMDIMKIHVKTATGTYDGDLEKELKINADNLSESYTDQAPKYAWWAVLAEQARSIVNNLENQIKDKETYLSEVLPKELGVKIRKEYKFQTLSDKELVSKIMTHPEYTENLQQLYTLRSKYVNANLNASILESAKQAFEHRKDMLLSLSRVVTSVNC